MCNRTCRNLEFQVVVITPSFTNPTGISRNTHKLDLTPGYQEKMLVVMLVGGTSTTCMNLFSNVRWKVPFHVRASLGPNGTLRTLLPFGKAGSELKFALRPF